MSVLETRRFHTLERKKAIDGLTMNTKHAADAHSVEAAIVDQAPDRLGMHAELRRNLSDADQALRLSAYRRHNPCEALQVPARRAWAERLKERFGWT